MKAKKVSHKLAMALVCGMTLAPLVSQTTVSADTVSANASSQVSSNTQCFSGTGRAMQTAQWIKDNPHMSASEKEDAQAKLDDLIEADKKAPVNADVANKFRSSIQTIYTGEEGLPRMDVWDMYSGTNGGNTITEQQFKDVKADGFKGIVVKATEGTGYVSPTAQSQINNATKAGLTVSTYHYAWFDSPSEAKAEADYYANRLDKLGVNKKARVILDLEEKDTANSQTGSSVKAFFDEMSNRGYVNHGLYTFSGYAQKDAAINAVGGKSKTWMAQYPYTPSANNLLNTDCGAWQYSPMAQIVDTSKNLKINGNNDVSIDYNGLLTRNLTTESSTPVTPTYSASFSFVDKDSKTVGTGKVSGSEGYTADISKYVPSGYQLVSGQTTKYTLGKDTVPKSFKVEKAGNTSNSQITGSISFVDSTTGKEVGTGSFGGDEGTTVDVSKMVPQGYDLVNTGDKTLTLKSGMNTKLTIKVKSNGTMNGTETVNREEIDFVDNNGNIVGKAYATGDRNTSVDVTKDLPADYSFVNDGDKMVLLDGNTHKIKVQKTGTTNSSASDSTNSSTTNNSSNNNTDNSSANTNDNGNNDSNANGSDTSDDSGSESINGANIAHNDSTTDVDSSSASDDSNPVGGIVGTTTTTNGASAVENSSSETGNHVNVGTTTDDNGNDESASESGNSENATDSSDKSSAYTESDADANYKGATATTNSAKGSSESSVKNSSSSDKKDSESDHKMGEGAESAVESSSAKEDSNKNDANLGGGTTTTTNGDKGASTESQKQSSSSESSSSESSESAVSNEGEPDGKAGTADAAKPAGTTGFAQTGGTSKFSDNWFYNFIYGSIPNFAHKVVHFFENLF